MGTISDKINIFNIPPIRIRVAVMYLTMPSHLHTAINFLWPPKPDENMLYLSPYRYPVPKSTKFCEKVEIPRKWTNFTAWLKTVCSVENCGP